MMVVVPEFDREMPNEMVSTVAGHQQSDADQGKNE